METDELQGIPEPLEIVLKDVARCFESRGVRYALIGGVATGIRSQIRATEDIDFIVEMPQIVLPRVLEDLESLGFEVDMTEVIRCWNQEHMVVLSRRGVRMDWIKPLISLYKHVIDTAVALTGELGTIRIATAEGLILTKLVAWRTQDQADIERLLAAHRGQLDLDYIRREWQTVGESDDARISRFGEMLAQFYSPPPQS
jgi:hypothetical protein